MKSHVISIALLSALGAAAFSANAAEGGTITFNGRVTAQTCEVGNSASGDFTVTLPTVKATDLNGSVGRTAGDSNFRVLVRNCTTGTDAVSAVRAQFEHDAAYDDASSGQLLNLNGVATNVRLQLFNVGAMTNIIKPGDASYTGGYGSQSFPVTGGASELVYGVRYISTNATVNAGDVQGRVRYRLSYN